MACADVNLGAQLPIRYVGEVKNAGEASRQSPTCGGRDQREWIFGWTAPSDGTYVIDTAETPFDTTLYVKSGACDGAPLACTDDGISYGGASKLSVTLKGGQTIAIVVDGATDWPIWPYVHLNIHRQAANEGAACTDGADNDGDGRVDCADSDCSSKPLCEYEACTTAAFAPTLPSTVYPAHPRDTNRFVGSCSPSKTTPDTGFRFTAPTTAEYLFMVASDDDWVGPPTVFLLDACRGRELACLPTSYRGTMRAQLSAGQTVIVVGDSLGWYRLKVDYVRPDETDCYDDFDNDADGAVDYHDPDCFQP